MVNQWIIKEFWRRHVTKS